MLERIARRSRLAVILGVSVSLVSSTQRVDAGGAIVDGPLGVAALIGEAATGVLHDPVKIGSLTEFRRVFGESGESVEAAWLAGSVRAFSQNGG